jgi:hypothetical protein
MSRRDRERERAAQRASGRGSWFKFFNPPEGVEVLKLKPEEELDFDIMPFLVDEHHPFYNDVMKDVEEFGERADYWFFRFGIHKNLKELGGEVFCPNATYGKILGYNHPKAKCPICEERFAQADENGDSWMDDKYKKYSYTTYVAYVVCPTDGPNADKFMVFVYPENWLHKKLDEKSKAENVYFLDTSEEGTTVHVLPTEQTFTGDDGKAIQTAGKCIVSFKDRTAGGFTAEDLDDVPDLMSMFDFKTYDEIYELFHGVVAGSDSEPEKEEVEEEMPEPSSGRRGGRASAPNAEAEPEVRTPNTNSRRGGGRRGGATETPAEEAPTTTGRRGSRRTASTEVVEDDITF